MSIKQRLEDAYQNISLNADRTWGSIPNSYQTANLKLYLLEQQYRQQKFQIYRPRTVREAIPESRLAQYCANGVYNESREMSYVRPPLNSNLSHVKPSQTNEIWDSFEVNELYKRFLMLSLDKCQIFDEIIYESPLFNVDGFNNRVLKYSISDGYRIKNLWKREKSPNRKSNNFVSLIVYNSSLQNFFVFDNNEEIKEKPLINDLKELKVWTLMNLSNLLSNEIKCLIPDKNNNNSANPSKSVLYSEVLQRFAPENPTNSVKQQESLKPATVSQTLYQQYTRHHANTSSSQQNFLDRSSTSYYPTQYFFSSWFIQNFIVTGANSFGSLLMSETNFECYQQAETNSRAFTIAEELLEDQAKEQYKCSNENFFQDLQRQAEAQYDENSLVD